MSVAISALLQVMFIILLGYLIRRLMRFNDSFWDELAKLTYFLLTPALSVSYTHLTLPTTNRV